MKRLALFYLPILLLASSPLAQREHPAKPTVTGAPLVYEQSSYDVQSYDVSIKVDVAAKTISGTTVMKAKVVMPTNVIMLDLDTPYTVTKVDPASGCCYKFERADGKIWVHFPTTKQAGRGVHDRHHLLW